MLRLVLSLLVVAGKEEAGRNSLTPSRGAGEISPGGFEPAAFPNSLGSEWRQVSKPPAPNPPGAAGKGDGMARQDKSTRRFWILAALLAWLVPGAGHVYLGRMRRGAILFLAIAATFWGGAAMGGVMTVDSRYDRWWFYAQSLSGVHGLAGWWRQEQVYRDVARRLGKEQILPAPDGRPTDEQMRVDAALREKGVVLANPTEGVARAYSGVAGLLNLLCVFDAALLAMMGRRGEPSRPGGTVGKEGGA